MDKIESQNIHIVTSTGLLTNLKIVGYVKYKQGRKKGNAVLVLLKIVI